MHVSTHYHSLGLNPRIGAQALPHGWIQTSVWGSPSGCKWKWVWLLALGSPGWEGSYELCWELPRSPDTENLPGKCWTSETLTLRGFWLIQLLAIDWQLDACCLGNSAATIIPLLQQICPGPHTYTFLAMLKSPLRSHPIPSPHSFTILSQLLCCLCSLDLARDEQHMQFRFKELWSSNSRKRS